MQAMVLRGTTLTVEEWPQPTPGSGELLVRVLAAGICASDVHAAAHLEAIIEETGHTSWYELADLDKGMVMGHEFVAEVVEAGPDVSGWSPGDRVVKAPAGKTDRPLPPRMASANSSELNGAFADYKVLWEPTHHPLPRNG
ncbi:MAG: alcohol dehydrogenase catalytic domain-containing protein, partial [Dehalococcoidia bacterium]|nr:alcohol dehydrogenase catalytic domain-containing protein [Dehalococcoidia bacterium]